MNYGFTDRVRKVLASARDEADRLRHDYVGTEHILLGLLKEPESGATAILSRLGVDVGEVRRRAADALRTGNSIMAMSELPYTPGGKKVLEAAMAEVRDLGLFDVGTEHLLVGLVSVRGEFASGLLGSLGITPDNVRAQL